MTEPPPSAMALTHSQILADHSEPIRPTTVADALREAATEAPTTPALVDGDADPSTRRRCARGSSSAQDS